MDAPIKKLRKLRRGDVFVMPDDTVNGRAPIVEVAGITMTGSGSGGLETVELTLVVLGATEVSCG